MGCCGLYFCAFVQLPLLICMKFGAGGNGGGSGSGGGGGGGGGGVCVCVCVHVCVCVCVRAHTQKCMFSCVHLQYHSAHAVQM